MQVSEVMTTDPITLAANDTAFEAARVLAKSDIGSVPVHDGDKLLGMVTDRDLVVRVLAEGSDPKSTPVSKILSGNIKYCYEDEDCERVAANMDELLVRRLPVVNREKRLVGIVSIEDIRPRAAA